MIELNGVSFSYRTDEEDEVRALDRVSLRVEEGERVAVIGHNGSGKSTLVKLLVSVIFPTAGELEVDGILSRAGSEWEIRERIAVVFQDPDDQLVMNRVADDVAFGPENLGLPPQEISARVESSLESLGLDDIAEKLIEDISPGQKQRVAIAGALAMQPKFLILDEATSLLPEALSRRLISTVKRLSDSEEMGILYITHSMAEAASFDRIVVMDGGRLVMDGPPPEVFRRIEELRDIGLDIPFAADLADRLRRRGFTVEGDVLDQSDLLQELSKLT